MSEPTGITVHTPDEALNFARGVDALVADGYLYIAALAGTETRGLGETISAPHETIAAFAPGQWTYWVRRAAPAKPSTGVIFHGPAVVSTAEELCKMMEKHARAYAK